MLTTVTARRYAEAVFQIAVEQGAVDRWRDDVRTIGEYFGNRQLAFILHEPKVPAQRKELIVRDLLAARVQPEALNLAMLLVERGLVAQAPGIANAFETLYNEYKGQEVATVTTALPLDADMRASVVRDLEAMTGKRILLQERVDPSVLGGVIARVGDTLIDGSVRRRLALLRERIAQGGALGGPDDGATAFLGGDPLSGGSAPFVVSPASGSSNGAAPAQQGPASGSTGSANPGSMSTERQAQSRQEKARIAPAGTVPPKPNAGGQGSGGQGSGGQGNGGQRPGGRAKRRRR